MLSKVLSHVQLFKKRDYVYVAVAASIIAGGIALANTQSKSPLQNSMAAYVVSVDAKGKETLQAATEVEPGQTVEYKLTYQNVSDKALKGLVVTGPVPAATHYIAKSARAQAKANLEVSIDGGKTFEKEPVKRIVTNEAGKKVETIIPPEKYTHLRWIMQEPLAANTTKQFAYRSLVK